jgi:hypothetical protein
MCLKDLSSVELGILITTIVLLGYYLYSKYSSTPETFYHHFEVQGPTLDSHAMAEKIMRPLDIKSCSANGCSNPFNMTIEEARRARINGLLQ